MPKPNHIFELSIEDLDLIEDSLRSSKLALAQERLKSAGGTEIEEDVRQIHDLLGRLHNQKTFYRPSKEPYIGG